MVVQITTAASATACTTAEVASLPEASSTCATGNLTHTVSEVWSSYSTSASASAVFSTTRHITGLEPR